MKRLRRRSAPKVAKDKGRYASFTRRTLLLSGGMTAVFGVLAGRLYQLQIVDGDSYLTQAEDNRISLRLLAPPRGRILDRFGVALAGSRRNYRVLGVPDQTRGGVAAAYDALAKVIPVNERVRGRVLKDAAGRKSFMPVLVADNLSWDDFARLNLELPYLPGVQPDVGETRDYPYADELSHVLGYVAAVSPGEKAQNAEAGDQRPLITKPLAGFYPPGSTFKTVTALTALDAGAITPDTIFHCSGQFSLGSHAFHCWKKGGHGAVNLRQGLKASCDCYFYQVAMKLGIDALQAGARRLGLGAPTGIEIPGERCGFIPDRYWKQATFN